MLKGKTAFITGCNRGIGKAVFEKFLSNGANIICSVRKLDNDFLNYIDLKKKNKKNEIKILEFDLSNDNQIKDAINILYKEKIKLDILVNNAGVATGSLLEMTSMNNLKNTFQINFFSQIRLIQLLLRLLKKTSNGSIINIGSISGLMSEKGTLSYGSSKAALMFATKVMANELSIYNIRVNSIAPSVTNTDMLKKMDKSSIDKILQETNLDKPSSVEEVANKVLYLASDESRHINGEIIKIDGESKIETK